MPEIRLTTIIAAPPERCFDLSRDLDLHVVSMSQTGEKAIGGRVSGLIELDEEVTWRARHFGVMHEHHSRITAFDRPRHFRDSMVRGRFRMFEHDHYFEAIPSGTRMTDVIVFASPFGVIGRIVDALVMSRHLTRLIERRNVVIRQAAEA